jgi:hypothetical protein
MGDGERRKGTMERSQKATMREDEARKPAEKNKGPQEGGGRKIRRRKETGGSRKEGSLDLKAEG